MNVNINLPENFLKEENRDGYIVSKKMKKVWAIELDLLNKFMKVCEKYNITYFMDSGTLLGTVRHKGFIPWDNDIDITMLREDYNKLCNVAESEFEYPYFFQTEYTDKGTCRGHAQLRNSDTTGIIKSELEGKFKFNQGIFIDIFPLDKVPNDLKKRKKFIKRLIRKRRIVNLYNNSTNKYIKRKGIKGIIKRFIRPFCIVIDYLVGHKNIFYSNYEKYAQKYNNKQNADYVAYIAYKPQYDKWIWKKEFFEETVLMDFEMLKVPVPKEYEKVLDLTYETWRKPKKTSVSHGEIIFDTEKSYKDYLKK